MLARLLYPVVGLLMVLIAWAPASHAESADGFNVGPQTESRFPPLVVPPGFRDTLFACDPLVEYPSVISLGPRPGTLFVAHDYMTGLGVEIIRRDEVRLLADSDNDGYADQSVLFADGFNSIQGLAFDGDAVYVMHAPFLTRVRDADGDDVADERQDLLSGLGLPPEENDNRLHCANGVVVGHDGWLYLALGDRGCDTTRPEGDRLLFQQGGILRCRTDGTDLHVFSSGLRNIYDVALDDELNVFVRDNENDGGDYMIRVCHCFHGSDHGYPYHYYERPDEHMPPLADLGRGSSAGGVAYLETAFPDEFRHSLYFCEWGRAVVRYPLSASGSGFATVQEADFAAGAADDPYGFKPTDLVVDYDGSLLISDWGDGQRPMRGRGRIYRIAAEAGIVGDRQEPVGQFESISDQELVSQLNSTGYLSRAAAQRAFLRRGGDAIATLRTAWQRGDLKPHGELHAVWILALAAESAAIGELLNLADSHADPRVVIQAIRAVADLSDPVLVSGRLDAESGDRELGMRLTQLASRSADPRVDREVVIALGRLRCAASVDCLRDIVDPVHADPAMSHAAVQTLRRSVNWSAVLQWLDTGTDPTPTSQHLRKWALLALAEQAHAETANGLIDRLESEPSPERRMEYVDLLSRIARVPGPWTYWGFRPGPRPANTGAWERTAAIQIALNAQLLDPERGVRVFTLRRLLREELPLSVDSLATWLSEESDPENVAALLDALASLPNPEALPLLEECVQDGSHSIDNRLQAMALLTAGVDAEHQQRLVQVADSLEDGPVLAALLVEFGSRPALDADSLLAKKLASTEAAVRAASIRALTQRRASVARGHVGPLLNDPGSDVLREAVAACAVFGLREHSDRIVELVERDDGELKRACLVTLRQLDDPRALSHAIAGLNDEVTLLASLEYLERFGDPSQLEAVEYVTRLTSDAEIHVAALSAIADWSERTDPTDRDRLRNAAARIHGSSGAVRLWFVSGPLTAAEADAALVHSQSGSAAGVLPSPTPRIGADAAAQIALATPASSEDTVWLAAADVFVDEETEVELLASSAGTLQIWLNGESVFQRATVSEFRPNSDTGAARLNSGLNRLLVRIDQAGDASAFHLGFRRRSSKAEHEQLMQYVLSNRGDLNRGRDVFASQEKSLCAKCHRLQPGGPRIGPDLTGIGRRFSRVSILESILEPSRTIAPSYATVAVLLTDGRLISGINVAKNESTMTIGDNQGQLHQVPLAEIDAISDQEISTMPIGLEQRLSRQELLDLVEYLSQQTD